MLRISPYLKWISHPRMGFPLSKLIWIPSSFVPEERMSESQMDIPSSYGISIIQIDMDPVKLCPRRTDIRSYVEYRQYKSSISTYEI
eukprot:6212093-Pleurochrysis_carterae.AAC.4